MVDDDDIGIAMDWPRRLVSQAKMERRVGQFFFVMDLSKQIGFVPILQMLGVADCVRLFVRVLMDSGPVIDRTSLGFPSIPSRFSEFRVQTHMPQC